MPLTAEDMARLSALWHAAFPHGEYGPDACALCRRMKADRYRAIATPDSDRVTL